MTTSTLFIIALVVLLVLVFLRLLKESEINRLNKSKIDSYILKQKDTENELKILNSNYEHTLKELTLGLESKEKDNLLKAHQASLNRLEEWKKTELEKVKISIEKHALEKARVELIEWKIQKEKEIRNDARTRSYNVTIGKIKEQLAPFDREFLSKFNPNDCRFIGSPIDMVVFDGDSDNCENISVCFVEIKSGNSKLKPIQRKVREAVIAGRISWAEVYLDNPDGKKIIQIELGGKHVESSRDEILLNEVSLLTESPVLDLEEDYVFYDALEMYNRIFDAAVKFKEHHGTLANFDSFFTTLPNNMKNYLGRGVIFNAYSGNELDEKAFTLGGDNLVKCNYYINKIKNNEANFQKLSSEINDTNISGWLKTLYINYIKDTLSE